MRRLSFGSITTKSRSPLTSLQPCNPVLHTSVVLDAVAVPAKQLQVAQVVLVVCDVEERTGLFGYKL